MHYGLGGIRSLDVDVYIFFPLYLYLLHFLGFFSPLVLSPLLPFTQPPFLAMFWYLYGIEECSGGNGRVTECDGVIDGG